MTNNSSDNFTALQKLVERLCMAVTLADAFLRGSYDMTTSPLYLVSDAAAEANYLLDMRDATAEATLGGESHTCSWTWDDDGFYATECGQSFFFDSGTPSENHFNFCPFCGVKIEVMHGEAEIHTEVEHGRD